MGDSLPEGWKVCNGVGKYIRNGDEVDIPDLSGRFILGAGQTKKADGTAQRKFPTTGWQTRADVSTEFNLDDVGGWEQHKLTEDELPGHIHKYTDKYLSGSSGGVASYDRWGPNYRYKEVDRETDPKGGDQPHNNMPPYYVLVYIIYVGDTYIPPP